jgi:hypothetical protein
LVDEESVAGNAGGKSVIPLAWENRKNVLSTGNPAGHAGFFCFIRTLRISETYGFRPIGAENDLLEVREVPGWGHLLEGIKIHCFKEQDCRLDGLVLLNSVYHTIEVQADRGKPNPKGLNREYISRKVTR